MATDVFANSKKINTLKKKKELLERDALVDNVLNIFKGSKVIALGIKAEDPTSGLLQKEKPFSQNKAS